MRNDITSRAYREFISGGVKAGIMNALIASDNNANKIMEPTMNKEFAVHILNDAGIHKAKMLAHEFDNLLIRISAMCPEGREFSITKTKLEEACFFAKKAIANDSINQKGDEQKAV